ncbi:MAG: ATP synthase F1 subunit epsilon [Candidatus Moranbacteria bacterium]|nr:ATP synthase F1 subunit epsilon [Candidatus Moranbacteria bacterium]
MSKEKKMDFKIVTPEEVVFSQEVLEVNLPTAEGQITILPNHESLIGIIVPGEICIKTLDKSDLCFVAVSEGFLEIDDNLVRVFAQTASRAENLDEQMIIKAKEEAQQALADKKNLSKVAYTDATSQLQKELIKLKVLKKHQKHKK